MSKETFLECSVCVLFASACMSRANRAVELEPRTVWLKLQFVELEFMALNSEPRAVELEPRTLSLSLSFLPSPSPSPSLSSSPSSSPPLPRPRPLSTPVTAAADPPRSTSAYDAPKAVAKEESYVPEVC